MVLYPLAAAIIVVIAQLAHTRAEIAEHPEDEAKLWKRYRGFCYVWATILVLAAFAGHYWYELPAGF
jgi:hypothetical protein